MDHIVNNPSLDHIDVAILCWASENTPFTQNNLLARFEGMIGMGPSFASGNPFGSDMCVAEHLQSLTEQFYLHKEIDSEGTIYYSYIIPPEDSGVPKLFKEFCHNYAAAGGKVQSTPFCWGRMKKHKGYKSFIKLLGPALDAQIAERARKQSQGKFVAEWRNLSTWINQRGWEDLISGDEMAAAPKSNEMAIYVAWVKSQYGATATAPLTEEQYLAYICGHGAFSGIKAKLSKPERQYLFERAHGAYLNNMSGKDSCYEYLVKLYQAKSL